MSSDAGKFTTVEGMINSIKENFNLGQPFTSGDSAREERKMKVKEFTDKLDQVSLLMNMQMCFKKLGSRMLLHIQANSCMPLYYHHKANI